MTKDELIREIEYLDHEDNLVISIAIEDDNDRYDIPAKIFSSNGTALLIYNNLSLSDFDEEEKIHDYLQEGLVTIELDPDYGILICDKNGNVLREMEFKEEFIATNNKETKIREIIHRLFGIL